MRMRAPGAPVWTGTVAGMDADFPLVQHPMRGLSPLLARHRNDPRLRLIFFCLDESAFCREIAFGRRFSSGRHGGSTIVREGSRAISTRWSNRRAFQPCGLHRRYARLAVDPGPSRCLAVRRGVIPGRNGRAPHTEHDRRSCGRGLAFRRGRAQHIDFRTQRTAHPIPCADAGGWVPAPRRGGGGLAPHRACGLCCRHLPIPRRFVRQRGGRDRLSARRDEANQPTARQTGGNSKRSSIQ